MLSARQRAAPEPPGTCGRGRRDPFPPAGEGPRGPRWSPAAMGQRTRAAWSRDPCRTCPAARCAACAWVAGGFGGRAFGVNDVNALALGEGMFGAGRGAHSRVVLAPGTGFGAGIVLEGRLVRGAAGFGGELGHAPVKFDGPPCWCGGGGGPPPFSDGPGDPPGGPGRRARAPGAPLVPGGGGGAPPA